MQARWQKHETVFLSRFALVVQKEIDHTRLLNLIFNFKQTRRSIVEYTGEGDQLNVECPKIFQDMLGYQFIAGLDDK